MLASPPEQCRSDLSPTRKPCFITLLIAHDFWAMSGTHKEMSRGVFHAFGGVVLSCAYGMSGHSFPV